MELLNKLGIFILIVLVALVLFVYFRYIKSGDPLPPDDKDWKKTRDEELAPKLQKLKDWVAKKAIEYTAIIDDIEVSVSKMFKQLWNDGIFQWGFIVEFFKAIGRLINWNKWRVVYIIILLIVFGLILHYVFGV